MRDVSPAGHQALTLYCSLRIDINRDLALGALMGRPGEEQSKGGKRAHDLSMVLKIYPGTFPETTLSLQGSEPRLVILRGNPYSYSDQM